MKKALLLSGLLLLVGIGSTKAQMNEKFNDGKIPSGWFADGWTVKDNAAQKGSNSQGFDMGSLMGGSSDFSVMSILTEGIPLGIANFVTIFGATILWLLTFWIPYLNVGTTIALNTMPIALADNEAPEGPTYIFKDKYRKYMGEYFVLMGLMYMAIWMASVFLIIPGIVISLAWSQALYLLFDKHLTPMDAMKESNEKTYGHKWTIFFTGLVFAIAFGIFAMIVLWLFITIDVMFLTVIAVLLLIALAMVGSVGINAVIYRKLCK